MAGLGTCEGLAVGVEESFCEARPENTLIGARRLTQIDCLLPARASSDLALLHWASCRPDTRSILSPGHTVCNHVLPGLPCSHPARALQETSPQGEPCAPLSPKPPQPVPTPPIPLKRVPDGTLSAAAGGERH